MHAGRGLVDFKPRPLNGDREVISCAYSDVERSESSISVCDGVVRYADDIDTEIPQ